MESELPLLLYDLAFFEEIYSMFLFVVVLWCISLSVCSIVF